MRPWSPPPRRGRFLKPEARTAIKAFLITMGLIGVGFLLAKLGG